MLALNLVLVEAAVVAQALVQAQVVVVLLVLEPVMVE